MSAVTFSKAFRAQLHQLWSIPAMRWLGLTAIGLGVGFTAVTVDRFPAQDNGSWVGAGMTFAALTFAVLAAIATAGSWATGSVQTELVATPRRRVLFLAKAAAVAASGFVLGTVTASAGDIVAGVPAGGMRVGLLSGVVTAAYGLFGFGAAALLRRVAPAVVAVILLCLVFPPFTLGGHVLGLSAPELTLTQAANFLFVGVGSVPTAVLGIALWALLPAAVAFLRFRTTDA